MSEYSVTVVGDASRSFTVQAESPEHAAEIADELYYEESSGLCHQCARELDVGDATAAVVYKDEKEVLNTGYMAKRVAGLEAERNALDALCQERFDEIASLRAELAAANTAYRIRGDVITEKNAELARPAQTEQQGTTSDKYRAELYDEVWEKARSMGYGNVTNALIELERMKASAQTEQQPVAYANPSDLNAMEKHGQNCITVWREKGHFVSEPLFLRASPIAQTPADGLAPDGWRPVPLKSLHKILALIDPLPVRMPNGDTMVFKNPNAGPVLREISLEIRAMLDATIPQPADGLVEALTLAANRLDRLWLDARTPREKLQIEGWVNEARAALAAHRAGGAK